MLGQVSIACPSKEVPCRSICHRPRTPPGTVVTQLVRLLPTAVHLLPHHLLLVLAARHCAGYLGSRLQLLWSLLALPPRMPVLQIAPVAVGHISPQTPAPEVRSPRGALLWCVRICVSLLRLFDSFPSVICSLTPPPRFSSCLPSAPLHSAMHSALLAPGTGTALSAHLLCWLHFLKHWYQHSSFIVPRPWPQPLQAVGPRSSDV